VTRLLRLVKLYPRDWRERYGDEFAELVTALAGERDGRGRLAPDIGHGALDAHLYRRYRMRRFLSDPALRRGCYDGLIIAAVMAVVVVLTNVVFPPGPTESDGDPEYRWQLLAGCALLAILFVLIGARGARRSGSATGGLRAGAVAGFVIALLVILDFLVVNNLFFSIVSRQHDKVVTFQASGWTSMRAYINVQLLRGAVFVIPAGTLVGGLLGYLGGAGRALLRPTRGRAPESS
jgi:hypothetical protein